MKPTELSESDAENELLMLLRHAHLVELSERLAAGAKLRMIEQPAWKVDYLAKFIMRKVRSGCWDLTRSDVRWLVNRVKSVLPMMHRHGD